MAVSYGAQTKFNYRKKLEAMCAKNSPNNWDKLLAEMGIQHPADEATQENKPVEIAVEEENIQPPPAVIVPFPATTEPVVSTKPTIARPASDWGRLAEELGVSVPPQPSKPSTEAKPVKSAVQYTTQREEKKQEDPLAFEPPIPNATRVWGELDDLAEPVSKESSEPLEEPKAKSRRRRRRRGRRLPESEPTESEIQEVELEAASDSIELIDVEPGVSSANADDDGASSPEGTESKGPKRRRRRRSRRKGEAADVGKEPQSTFDREEREDADKPRAKKPVAEHDEDTEDEWCGADVGHEDEEEGSFHLSHRGIPTWEEAIQVVITHNLDSRAKHPNSNSSPRGHGNRRARGKPADR